MPDIYQKNHVVKLQSKGDKFAMLHKKSLEVVLRNANVPHIFFFLILAAPSYNYFQCLENPKNIIFALLWGKMMKITTFLHFVAFFGKPIPKIHKIRSYEDDMSKILSKNFGPLGLPWGHWGQDLRRGSQKYFQMWFSCIIGTQMKHLRRFQTHYYQKKLVTLRKRCVSKWINLSQDGTNKLLLCDWLKTI